MTTLRRIIDKICEQYLDAELSIVVVDGHLNVSHMDVPLDYHTFPRSDARPGTGEPARLAVRVHLCEHRLVKAKNEKS